MWKSRYKNTYKTSKPNLIITGVMSFPNIIDTVEKAIVDYRVKQLQQDPILLEIVSLVSLHHGRDFIPLYFEDDCPKLKKLPFLQKGMFWCIGYKCPAITWEHPNGGSRSVTLPSYERFRELLDYSLSNLNGESWEYLFENCVNKWVLKQTELFDDRQNSKRFKSIYNTYLHFLRDLRDEGKHIAINFLNEMEKRDIYEFMFNEFA